MDTSLHSHLSAIRIQERMERAAGERLARDVRPRPRRLTIPFRIGRVRRGTLKRGALRT